MLKEGDRVECIAPFASVNSLVGKQGTVRGFKGDSIGVEFDSDFGDGHDLGGLISNWRGRWGAAHEIKKISGSKSMTLSEKFAVAFKGEPEKSFIKAGVMNTDESLTSDGQALFLAYLLKKNGDAFKTEIVDPILAEEEKK